ncbi:transglycosylase SLT domain-containing protein [Propylenella binzhouense]|uniref:Lytic transglycosylase domain-containing protein n=1 Tax=Propylenella binzhouense TaxID=2555902 RepID=A0A964WUI9_9HYPH|nr:transglycosylase SLT domain-containing protein [Propylenella binzhouense]MYZ48890.1 lytic transglycosylase domain-containing protein [Propylenella binzhouense]
MRPRAEPGFRAPGRMAPGGLILALALLPPVPAKAFSEGAVSFPELRRGEMRPLPLVPLDAETSRLARIVLASPPPELMGADQICGLLATAAASHELPVGFFTRLIYQESRFDPRAVSRKGAQGIAQFMPGTAAERALADPFDPAAALPASAALLSELRARFGNLGLAAAAYNAGAQRVSSWLGGRARLPSETLQYVRLVTGRSAQDWSANAGAPVRDEDALARVPNCRDLIRLVALPPQDPAEAPPSTVEQPWGVEVAKSYSRDDAVKRFRAMQQRFPGVLGGKPMMIKRIILRAFGPRPFYRLRVPSPTREEADALCRRLRQAGGSCVVLGS